MGCILWGLGFVRFGVRGFGLGGFEEDAQREHGAFQASGFRIWAREPVCRVEFIECIGLRRGTFRVTLAQTP